MPKGGKLCFLNDLTGVKAHKGGIAGEGCADIVKEGLRCNAGHAGHELYAECESMLFYEMTCFARNVASVMTLRLMERVVVKALYAKFDGAKACLPQFA